MRRLLILIFLGATLVCAQIPNPNISCAHSAFSQPLNSEQAHRITAAIDALEKTGADVRVQILDDIFPTETLDAYEAHVIGNCPSWQTNNHDIKGNLIVLLIKATKPRMVGLYYGHQWDAALDGKWPEINGKVVPLIRSNDYVSAVVRSLQEVTHTIVAYNAPPDTSWIWGIIVLLLFTTIALTWFSIWRNRRRDRQACLGAQQEAIIRQQRATEMIADLGDNLDLSTKAMINSYGKLGSGAMDPTLKLTVGQYEAIGRRYQEIIDRLQRLDLHKSFNAQKESFPTAGYKDPLRADSYQTKHVHREYVIEERPSVLPVFIPVQESTPYQAPSYREPTCSAPEPPSYSGGGGSSEVESYSPPDATPDMGGGGSTTID